MVRVFGRGGLLPTPPAPHSKHQRPTSTVPRHAATPAATVTTRTTSQSAHCPSPARTPTSKSPRTDTRELDGLPVRALPLHPYPENADLGTEVRRQESRRNTKSAQIPRFPKKADLQNKTAQNPRIPPEPKRGRGAPPRSSQRAVFKHHQRLIPREECRAAHNLHPPYQY